MSEGAPDTREATIRRHIEARRASGSSYRVDAQTLGVIPGSNGPASDEYVEEALAALDALVAERDRWPKAFAALMLEYVQSEGKNPSSETLAGVCNFWLESNGFEALTEGVS